MKTDFRADGAGGDIAYTFEPVKPYTLILARMHFVRVSGSGTDIGATPLTMALNAGTSRRENHTRYNQILWQWRNVGVGSDAEFWIPENGRDAWKFGVDDWLTFAWTNPDAPEIAWGLWLRVEYPDQ